MIKFKRNISIELREKKMHKQCKIILHYQQITPIFSAMLLYLTPLFLYDMKDWSIFISCQCKINLNRLYMSFKLYN
jgi:hypothetical protein